MKLNWLKALIVGTFVVSSSVGAQAQTYPSKPIRLVVPFPPGGSGDFVARLAAARLKEAWGQDVLVENRSGAAGTIGATTVAKAPADGYTLLLADDSVLSIAPQTRATPPYDATTDFTPVALMTRIQFAIVTNNGVGANNLPELVGLFKAHPGRYSYASSGEGSVHHLSIEGLKRLADVDVLHVPYKGSNQMLPDVIGNVVQLSYVGLQPAWPLIRAGQLKLIAVSGPQRSAQAPNVQTIAESYPGFDGSSTWMVLGPAGLPAPIVQRLNVELNRILKDPAVIEQMVTQGLTPVGGSPADAIRYVADGQVKWGRTIREINLRQD